MSVLEVVSLTGGYSKAPVLREVNLAVKADEIVGVLGANGAGKTTLLRALSGTLPVCSGEVNVDGRSVAKLPPWSRVAAGLVQVPEGRRVYGPMTVKENLDVAALVGRGRITYDHVFALFPLLAERRRQLAGSLSGGEQQMLAIGRALMCAPRVLAIDEMSAGLAPVIAGQLVDGLLQLRGRDMAVLLVEQSPGLIARAVDRVCVLEQGRIVAAGKLEELGGVDRLAELYLGVA